MTDTNDIVNLFYGDISISDLEKQLGIDQRKIRKVWREHFSDEVIGERVKRIKAQYIRNKRGLDSKVIEQIYELTIQGKVTSEIARHLKISVGVVQKYLGERSDIKRVSLKNTKNERSRYLKEMRDVISEQQRREVVRLFYTDKRAEDIAKQVGLSKNSIYNIFKKCFSSKEYDKRKQKQISLGKIKSMQSLIKAGRLGSKPEREFYQLICEKLSTVVVHHDLHVMPPFEIDITMPEYKIAIMWDGIGHHKPIFGEKVFKQVVYRDKQKRKYLGTIGWKYFEVIDLHSRCKMNFIEEQFRLLINNFPELRDVLND